MDIKVLKSEFLYSVPELSMMQNLSQEICFVGRSNVGKSSIINALCQKRDLARTSKLPGRTRHAVCYDVEFFDDVEKKSCVFVDLPGFGYAAMSKSEAKACEELIFSYIRERRQLQLLVLLLDIRRSPDEREKQVAELALRRNLPLLVVLTKCDKIVVSKRKAIEKSIASELGLYGELMLHSAHMPTQTLSLRAKIFSRL